MIQLKSDKPPDVQTIVLESPPAEGEEAMEEEATVAEGEFRIAHADVGELTQKLSINCWFFIHFTISSPTGRGKLSREEELAWRTAPMR